MMDDLFICGVRWIRSLNGSLWIDCIDPATDKRMTYLEILFDFAREEVLGLGSYAGC